MRYYSDELKKFFDTEEQCLSAEEKAREEAENQKVTKSKLAKVIEDADKNLDEAYKGLEQAKKSVQELQKEYDQKVDEIMNPAIKLVQDCAKERANAIKEFNDNFGVYTTTYVGDKALNEFAKFDDTMNKLFRKFNF